MAAGLAEWRKKIEDIVALLDADYEATRPKARGHPTRHPVQVSSQQFRIETSTPVWC